MQSQNVMMSHHDIANKNGRTAVAEIKNGTELLLASLEEFSWKQVLFNCYNIR